jgi:hypothetical protein
VQILAVLIDIRIIEKTIMMKMKDLVYHQKNVPDPGSAKLEKIPEEKKHALLQFF